MSSRAQKICRVCKDKRDVRAVLDKIWNEPWKAQETIVEALGRNSSVFEFEKVLAN